MSAAAISVALYGQHVGTIRQSGEYSIARLRPDLESYAPDYERGEQCFAFRSLALGWIKSRARCATNRARLGRVRGL